MKLLNVFFAFLLVTAFSSCDVTKNLTSTTPTTDTTDITNTTTSTTSRSTPTTRSAPKKPNMSTPSTPNLNKDVEVGVPATPAAKTAPKKPTVSTGKIPAKSSGTMKDRVKPTKAGMDNNPGTITWEAANERYSANGTFTSWRVTNVRMIGDDLTTLMAKIEIDLSSISEKSPKLTDHLKAADYFGVEEHKLATIHVTKVTEGKAMHSADMLLKMRGKEQKLKGTFEVVSMKPFRIKGFTMLDRSIFGIGVENTSVPNEIKVMFDTLIPR